jgi:hypothetical protein|tara:strand:+ start:1007 stop:1486 length:480 start_codon:yes stop_codon:yes gene_type:complete
MATIRCKGLTGVEFDLTVTMGTTTMNGLTALAQAVEGQEIVTAMYAEIHAVKDTTINQTNDGASTLTAAGLVDGDRVYCIPRYSGVTGFKRQRQEEKLRIAVSKRKGLAAADTNATYYRALNTKTKNDLPTLYTASNNDSGTLVNNANTGGLVTGRPWT